jgi:hypothetical protein
MAESESDSSSSAASISSTATHPQPRTAQQVVFTVPNMNPNLHIKFSKGKA